MKQAIKLGQPLLEEGGLGIGLDMVVEQNVRRGGGEKDGGAAPPKPSDIVGKGRALHPRFAADADPMPTKGCGRGPGRRRLVRRLADCRDAAAVRAPVVAHFLEQAPAAEELLADWRTGGVDAAARGAEMRAGGARLLAQLRRINLQLDASDGAWPALALVQRRHGSSRLVAVSMRLSRSAIKASRFSPGAIGSRNSSTMVPGFLMKPVQ